MGSSMMKRVKNFGLIVTVIATASCKSAGANSTVKDSVWVRAQGSGVLGYASIVQSATAGSYSAYFFGASDGGVKICHDTDSACQNDARKLTPMLPDTTADGQAAWQSAATHPMAEGDALTFYVGKASTSFSFIIKKSPNGQLDPVALDAPAPSIDPDSAAQVAQQKEDPWVPNPNHVAITEIEASIIRETNIARQQTNPNLQLLTVREDLMAIARQTASYNARYNAANRHSGANTFENVYYAMPDAHATVFGSAMGPGWLTHPGHRENLLNPSISFIGTAMYQAANGTPHWVEDML